MSVELSLMIAVAGIAVLQVAGGYFFLKQRRTLDRVEDRVAHLTAGISLLTDTTEAALRDIAQEITRLSAARPDRPRARALTQRRLATAVKRGRSVQEIAATEQVAEGEVMLRLQLADRMPAAGRDRVHDAAAR